MAALKRHHRGFNALVLHKAVRRRTKCGLEYPDKVENTQPDLLCQTHQRQIRPRIGVYQLNQPLVLRGAKTSVRQ